MKNSIWLLLPVVVMFILFYMAFEIIPFGPNPFIYWWDFPTMIVMCFVFMASLVVGLTKCLD